MNRRQEQRIISDIYRAAAGLIDQASVLDDFKDLLGCRTLSLVRSHPHLEGNELIVHRGISQGAADLYRDYYYRKNLVFQRGLPLLVRNGIAQSADVVTDRELINSEFHAEWERLVGNFYTAGVFFQAGGGWIVSVIPGRSRRRGPFTAEELTLLGRFRHHMCAAMEIESHLSGLRSRQEQVEETLGLLDEPVFIVNGHGRIRYANPTAFALAELGEPVEIVNGALCTAGEEQSTGLRTWLAEAEATRHGVCGMLQGESTAGTYRVLVVPLGCGSFPMDLGHPSDFAVFIHDPNKMVPSVQHLATTYGLTGRESEVVMLLVKGLPPSEVADALSIGVETARSHLKRAMDKLGVHSQAGLVSRVLRELQPVAFSSS